MINKIRLDSPSLYIILSLLAIALISYSGFSQINKIYQNYWAELDTAEYPKGLTISDADLSAINIERSEFHGDWNYWIRPR